MRYCLAILALLLMGAAPAIGVTETRRAIGAYELVERTYRLEPGEVPIMHVTQNYATLALTFGDATFNVSLVDTGNVVSFEAGGTGCLGSQWPLRWRGKRGERELFRDMVRYVASLEKSCGRDRAVSRGFLARLKASRPDFAVAVEAMKTRVLEIMRPLRSRCAPIRFRGGMPAMSPDPFDPCGFHGQ